MKKAIFFLFPYRFLNEALYQCRCFVNSRVRGNDGKCPILGVRGNDAFAFFAPLRPCVLAFLQLFRLGTPAFLTLRKIVGCLFALMCICSAFSQEVIDDFQGGLKAALPWSWQVPGNSPLNTLDESRIQYAQGWLQVTLQSGTLQGNASDRNNIRNLPSLPVRSFAPGWTVETRIRLTLNGITGAYIQAGLVLFTNADNYFNFHLTMDPFDANRLKVSAGHELSGSYQWTGITSTGWNPALGNQVRLQIRQDPQTKLIHFYYDRENGVFWQEATGSPKNPADYPALQAILDQGGSVGLYTDAAGRQAGNMPVAAFDYLELYLPPSPTDLNKDGCVDDIDLIQVLLQFGATGPCLTGDVNGNQSVDDDDLLQMLIDFGKGC